MLFYVNFGIIYLGIHTNRPRLKGQIKRGGVGMLESLAVGLAAYYGFVAVIGVLVNLRAVEATLLFFAIVCFGGAYFARRVRIVRRAANLVGGICIAIYLVIQFALPIFQGRKYLVILIATVLALVVYGITRRLTFRHFFGRRGSTRPAPPWGSELARWLLAFLV